MVNAYRELVQNGLELSKDVLLAVIGACSKEWKQDIWLVLCFKRCLRLLDPPPVLGDDRQVQQDAKASYMAVAQRTKKPLFPMIDLPRRQPHNKEDSHTKMRTRCVFVGCCVKIYLAKVLPPKIWIDTSNSHGWWQKVIYEVNLKFGSKSFLICTLMTKLSLWMPFMRSQEKKFTISVVYAACSKHGRRTLWDVLLNLNSRMKDPWLVGGDFNVISNWSERRGGRFVDDSSIAEFNSFIMQSGLINISSSTSAFSWTNNQQDCSEIYRKLDKILIHFVALVNALDINMSFLPRCFSDLMPMLISFHKFSVIPLSFEFQRVWCDHENFNSLWKENEIWCIIPMVLSIFI
uniref:Endonuclease/exonuclease/phosphatase domain-containing protein n=1 Tax=Kalanchoe fedtschenkoi TaxID=63787 RepID=A0A7N0T5Z1_KALFE